LLAQDFSFEAVAPLYFPDLSSTAGAGNCFRVICANYVQLQSSKNSKHNDGPIKVSGIFDSESSVS
jgi:hypothetical protein